MAGSSILIVEDNLLNLRLLSYLLDAKGYEIHTATNAQETWDCLKKTHPDLILMDIQLPGVDGLELTQQLKAHPEYKHIPIVAVSAYAMDGDKERALSKGCEGYITKPIDIKTFPLLIAEYLNKDRIRNL